MSVERHSLSPKVFGSILPEAVEWLPFAAFPPDAQLAVLVGDPKQTGPYVVRVRARAGAKLMPHQHPEDRIYTVIAGVFYIGLGSAFDPEKLTAFPPGSVVILPGNTHHFHWAKSGDYITQVSGYGPLGIDYIDPQDDPRRP
jgi:quercetin dioxygenase-like cupin family protein